MQQSSKRYEVRFQEIRAFAITVEATNDRDVDQLALAAFKANPEAARLLRSHHAFFTIETLTSATA